MRWFVRSCGKRPDHLPPGGLSCTIENIHGLVVAGSMAEGESLADWHDLGDGCWFHINKKDQPRLRAHRPELETAVDAGDMTWTVSQILKPDAGGLRCALPCTWTLAGFVPPAWAVSLMDDLCAFAADPQEYQGPELACRILGVSYYVSVHEISAAGWLTDIAIQRIILAACGLDWRVVQ
jgi:hypothetical protein